MYHNLDLSIKSRFVCVYYTMVYGCRIKKTISGSWLETATRWFWWPGNFGGLVSQQPMDFHDGGSVWWLMNLEPVWAKPDPDSNPSSLSDLHSLWDKLVIKLSNSANWFQIRCNQSDLKEWGGDSARHTMPGHQCTSLVQLQPPGAEWETQFRSHSPVRDPEK